MSSRISLRARVRNLALVVLAGLALGSTTACAAQLTNGQAASEFSATPVVTRAKDILVTEGPSLKEMRRDGVIELAAEYRDSVENKFFDVDFEVTFVSPHEIERRVPGFYYDGDEWRVRFRPDEAGSWSYSYALTTPSGDQVRGVGNFDWQAAEIQGRVEQNLKNPYRWKLSTGSPYFPIGIQDCVVYTEGEPAKGLIDGELRDNARARELSLDEYFSIYGEAGFNLLRFSQRNCSYNLFDDLDHYRLGEIKATDELLSLARKHGLHIMYGIFGFYDQVKVEDPVRLEKQKRFVRYSVARWGAYVDIWELLNESKSSPEWVTEITEYIHSLEPYRTPVSTSHPMPDVAAIDIHAPHWYESENVLIADRRLYERANEFKRQGKPVIVGEQGNTGMNWDPESALRMRLHAWTALFEEIALVFWNTSWAKNGMFEGVYRAGKAANIYLGPEERKYIRVLQDFAHQLDTEVQQIPVQSSAPAQVRAYGLASSNVAAVYLVHTTDHASSVNDLRISIQLPPSADPAAKLVGTWIDPATGKRIGQIQLNAGAQTLPVPPFQIDLALLVRFP